MIGFGQQTYVPDDIFEQELINLGYDSVLDDSVLTVAIDTITILNLNPGPNGFNISDLTGIEDFTSLTILNLYNGPNGLTSLDLSQNTALTQLGISSNSLTSLDLSNNTALTNLLCDGNQLTSLDLSNNLALTNLSCEGNQLTSLDVSNNTALTNLHVLFNQLTSLDLSLNTALTQLDCDNNQLTSLDLSNNTALSNLWCEYNQLTSLDLRNGNNINLGQPHISMNPNLICISVDDSTYSTNNWGISPQSYWSNNCPPVVFGCTDSLANNYSSLANIDDGSCLFYACFFTLELWNYLPSGAQYLGWSNGNGSYHYLQIYMNGVLYDTLTMFTGSNYTSETYIIPISDSVTANVYFTSMGSGSNECMYRIYNQNSVLLTTQGFPGSTPANFSFINYCDSTVTQGCTDSNALNYDSTAIINDGSCYYGKTYVPDDFFEAYLENNGMGDGIAFNDSVLTGNINTVMSLYVSYQNIFDLTGIQDFTALTSLTCFNNQLTSLDLSNNLALTYLRCDGNQLTSLDLSNNLALTYLNCEGGSSPFQNWNGNQLTSLDLSNNLALVSLVCNNNQLTSLDLSNNPALEDLYCSGNQLTSLDLSNNLALFALDCHFNQLTSLDVSVAINLTHLRCQFNQLTSLNLSNNLALIDVNCEHNQITSLDLSGATFLSILDCSNNQLTSLDIHNHPFIEWLDCTINQLITLDLRIIYLQTFDFGSGGNPNLLCIDFDDIVLAQSLFASAVDPWTSFSTDCITALGCTDQYACNYDSSATLDDGSCLYLIDSVIITPPSCYGINDGSVSVSISGGSFPYQYSLNGNPSQSNGIFTNLSLGTYSLVVTDTNGCTSTQTFTINGPSPLIINNNLNGCDSVLVGSNYYSISGVYTDSLTSVNGCDSVVNTNLTIWQNTVSYDTLTVSASIVWNGMLLNVSGDYSVTFFISLGCDSIVNLNLTITIPSSILNITNTEKTIVKITNMLGQETPYRRNTTLFYIYDDGTVEKKLIIE
jgi:Leucine-rich repeat (LRR) protein